MGDRSEQTEVIARGVWVEGGHVLVCRNVERGHCFLPGGHVDFNEPAPVALARELYEEAGLRVTVGAFLGVVEAAFDQMSKKKKAPIRHHELNLLFAFAPRRQLIRAGTPPLPVVKSREGHIEFTWLPVGYMKTKSRVQSPESGVQSRGEEGVAGGLSGGSSERAPTVREGMRSLGNIRGNKHVPRGTRLREGSRSAVLDSGLGTLDSGLPGLSLPTPADLLPHGIDAFLLEYCTSLPHPTPGHWRSLWSRGKR